MGLWQLCAGFWLVSVSVFDVLIGTLSCVWAAVQQLMTFPLVSLHASLQISFHMHPCITVIYIYSIALQLAATYLHSVQSLATDMMQKWEKCFINTFVFSFRGWSDQGSHWSGSLKGKICWGSSSSTDKKWEGRRKKRRQQGVFFPPFSRSLSSLIPEDLWWCLGELWQIFFQLSGVRLYILDKFEVAQVTVLRPVLIDNDSAFKKKKKFQRLHLFHSTLLH